VNLNENTTEKNHSNSRLRSCSVELTVWRQEGRFGFTLNLIGKPLVATIESMMFRDGEKKMCSCADGLKMEIQLNQPEAS
jgi:hypothetical protein